MRKVGTLEPVIYFVNQVDTRRPRGYIVLAPYSNFPTPDGHTREFAETLSEVDRLQKRLQEQEHRRLEEECIYDETLIAAGQQKVVDNLRATMISSSTSPYEREFIELYLQLRDEKKRAKYRAILEQRQAFLYARENDFGKNRAADDERFNVDRIG